YTPSGRLIQRDFKTVSLYTYYYRKKRDDNDTAGQVYQTDSGRTVYAGGGIEPDVVVPRLPLNRFQELLVRRDVFFNFAKHFLADRDTVSRDFGVDAYVLNRFRRFLDQRNIRFTKADIQETHDWLARQIKKYIFISVFGLPEGFRVELEGDYQVQKALELLPQAAELAATARRVAASRKP
ncbi:MAG: S41 family peptidase, partial [Terriglobia bacterium]